MAELNDQQQPEVDDTIDPALEDQQQPDGQDGGDEVEASPYDELAQEMGWVPKDKYKGDVEKWRPAKDFILEGRNIQKQTRAELRDMKRTLDTVAKTSASIVEQRIAEERARIQGIHRQAVEDGDERTAFAAAQRLTSLEQQAAPQPAPEAQSWAERNEWFGKDPAATARAYEICDVLAKRGFSQAQQLEAAEREVQKAYPELFKSAQSAGKPQAQVNSQNNRSARPAPRAKGFGDMPKAAQDIARGMAERGVIKSADDYAANYWKMQEGNV